MPSERKKLERICVSEEATVGDALRTLAVHKPAQTKLPAGIVLILNNDGRLSGIVTNGDLNRALARGISMETPLTLIMNKEPFVIVAPRTNQEIISIVVNKIRSEQLHKNRLDKLVVVDNDGRVIDVANFFDVWQASDVSYKHIGIIGLGFVGLTLGVTLADIGFRVKGVDTDNALCRLIRKNNPPFFEEGLPLLLAEHNGDRFTVVDNLEGENSCDVYMVAVGTPLGKNKSPQMKAVRSAAKTLGSILKPGDLIVLRSTVPLGTTRNEFIPIVEKLSGLVAGEEFFVVFAPERTVEGKALAELRTLPQVIGGINHASANMAANIFQKMTNSIHVVDSLEEAEMVKLINNTYRDVTFGFANEIALICQKWGIDANTVIDVANRGYERSHVPKPSPGVGGYCLEKDAHILMRSASAKGLYPRVIQHARESNKEILNTLAQEVYNVFRARKQKIKNPKVLIMGFAFKGRPVTSDMRGSTTIQLVERLQKVGCVNIHGYDPNVASEAIRALKVTPVTDVKKGFEGADVIVFMTNHEAFEKLDIRSLLSSTRQSPILFDTWALFSKEHVTDVNGTDYRRL